MRKRGCSYAEIAQAFGKIEGKVMPGGNVHSWAASRGLVIPFETVAKVRRDNGKTAYGATTFSRRVPSGQEVREAIEAVASYSRELGAFFYKTDGAHFRRGDRVGSECGGYLNAKVCGRSFRVHRLVWLFEHGEFPDRHIDHVDMDRKNNRIENLRLATPSENVCNSRVRPSNQLGIKGVGRDRGKYRARITVDGVCYYLGAYATPEAARKRWLEAALFYHGEFARLDG